MKYIDRVLQRWRISKAARYIRAGDRVLDIGAADGALFRHVPTIGEYVGVDPDVPHNTHDGRRQMIRGRFPHDLSSLGPFDVIALLAVLEHIPLEHQPELAASCARFLKPNGRLLITVPSPFVDHILWALKAMRLIDGMSLEQHFGFDPGSTETTFTAAGMRLERCTRFQLGLNRLFVFTPQIDR